MASIFRRLFTSKQSRRKNERRNLREKKNLKAETKLYKKEYEQAKKLYKKEYGKRQSLLDQLKSEMNSAKGDITKNPLFRSASGFLQSLTDQSPEAMRKFEAPAMRQFQEEIVPGVANQFAGAGALSSSGFQQALGRESANLVERLAALRGGLGLQASQQGLNYAQQPIANRLSQYQSALGLNTAQNVFVPSSPQARPERTNYAQAILPTVGTVGGAVIGGVATEGNPAGISAGAQIGNSVGQSGADFFGSQRKGLV